MLHNRIGNVASGRTPLNTGSGIAHRKAPFGHVSFGGGLGDVFRITAAEFFDNIAQGYIFVQASGASVKIYTTLADMDLALNPEFDTSDIWISAGTIAPGSIFQITTLASAVRLEPQGDGVYYIAGL